METPKIVKDENYISEGWSGAYSPPETPATYGLGLCGEGVIRPREQRELEDDVERMRLNRVNARAQSREIPLV